MYICKCICTYTLYFYVHVYAYVYAYAYVCICICVCAYTSMYVCICRINHLNDHQHGTIGCQVSNWQCHTGITHGKVERQLTDKRWLSPANEWRKEKQEQPTTPNTVTYNAFVTQVWNIFQTISTVLYILALWPYQCRLWSVNWVGCSMWM